MSDRATRRALSFDLADAFLAGAWTEDALWRRARAALQAPAPRWLRPLVREVLAAYERAPADRPRELAAYVGIVLDERRTRGPIPRVRHPFVGVTPRMAPTPWPAVPAIATLGDLAGFLVVDHGVLEWLADAQSRERRARDERLRNYRYGWVPRRNGPARLIEAPKQRLKGLQRRVLDDILVHVPPHPAAHGFVRGRSARTHAAAHAGRPVVLALDLRDFFLSIAAGRVYGIFRAAGYPEGVAHALTALATNAAPVDVCDAAPFSLRRRLRTPHLPQGAPTSPALANLVAFRLDRRFAGLAAAAGATYTRYADDLTFSGSHGAISTLRAAVAGIVRDEGFAVHPAKTRFMTAAGRQRVTGVVVNAHPNLARDEYDRLRAAVHHAERGEPYDRAQLLGRISWLASLNPSRGARLRARLEAITA